MSEFLAADVTLSQFTRFFVFRILWDMLDRIKRIFPFIAHAMGLAIQWHESANCILRFSAHRIAANNLHGETRARARIDSFNLLRRNLSLQRHRISSIPLSRNLLFIDIVIFLLKKCRFRKRKESTLQPKRARSCQAERASRADPCIALPPRSPIAISPSISRDVGIATLQHFREHEHAPMTKTCHGRSNYVCMDAQWHNLRCTARLGSITNIRQPILSNDQRICGRSPCARDIMSTTTD